MISRTEAHAEVQRHFPSISERWDAYEQVWGREAVSLCSEMSEFERYIEDLFEEDSIDYQAIAEAFDMIERFIADGDDDTRSAAATCFLEDLLNNGKISSKVFGPYLRPRSRAHCEAWDQFTGVESEY